MVKKQGLRVDSGKERALLVFWTQQSHDILKLSEVVFLDEGERGEWKSWCKTQHSKNEDHSICCHHFMANRWGNNGNSDGLYFLGLQNHCRW